MVCIFLSVHLLFCFFDIFCLFCVCPSVIFFWYMLFILLSFLQFFARSQTLSGNFSFYLILKPQKPKPNWKYSTYYLGDCLFSSKNCTRGQYRKKAPNCQKNCIKLLFWPKSQKAEYHLIMIWRVFGGILCFVREGSQTQFFSRSFGNVDNFWLKGPLKAQFLLRNIHIDYLAPVKAPFVFCPTQFDTHCHKFFL